MSRTGKAVQCLTRHRKNLEEKLEQALVDNDRTTDIRSLIENIDALQKYERKLHAPLRQRVLLGCFIAFAIAPLIWSLHTRSRDVSIDINVTATEMIFDISKQTPFGAPDSLAFENLQSLKAGKLFRDFPGPNLANGVEMYKDIEIVEVRVLPSTRIRMSLDGEECGFVEIIDSDIEPSGPRLSVTFIVGRPADNRVVPDVKRIEVGTGDVLYLCNLHESHMPIFMGSVSGMEFMRIYKEDDPPLLVSTIIDGRLKISETGKTFELSPNDRLILEHLSEAQIMIGWRSGYLYVTAAGTLSSGFLRSNYPEYSEGTDLLPSVFELVAQSPFVLALSFIVGLIGTIWNVVEMRRR